MASAAQIIANQENATHSTGPRTEAGKKRASLNSFRHGLTSQRVILPTEDIDAYQTFTAAYHADLKPKGVIEEQLVQTLADIQWRLNRAKAHEAAIFAMGTYEIAPGSEPVSPEVLTTIREAKVRLDQTAALNSLSLHEHRWQKLYLASLKQLQDIQTARRERERTEMERAVIVYKQCKLENLPFRPEDFGFVLTEDDVHAYIWRVNALRQAEKALRDNPKASQIRV